MGACINKGTKMVENINVEEGILEAYPAAGGS